MAVMGRKKQMVRHIIETNRSKTKEEGEKSREKAKESQKEIDEQEHNKRVEMLKGLGFLKED